jgi:hypothetical protein
MAGRCSVRESSQLPAEYLAEYLTNLPHSRFLGGGSGVDGGRERTFREPTMFSPVRSEVTGQTFYQEQTYSRVIVTVC